MAMVAPWGMLDIASVSIRMQGESQTATGYFGPSPYRLTMAPRPRSIHR